MRQAGFTPLEALCAGTRNAAIALDLQEQLGTLEPGKLADVLIVDGDPLGDISVLQDKQRLSTILKGGQVVDTSAPWPSRQVYPHERMQFIAARPLLYEEIHSGELARSGAP